MHIIPHNAGSGLVLYMHLERIPAELTQLTAQLALRGPVRVLDGGNVFQAYPIARMVRRHTADLDEALGRLQIARAFTCHQVYTLLHGIEAIQAPTIALNLLTTFYDENEDLDESHRLLRACITELRRLASPGVVVISARIPKPQHEERAFFLEELAEAADRLITVTPPPQPEQLNLF
ncbi:MAG: hypothetical protein GWN58_00095 [Anaerolineae bacterium]|nr:hypothetical protein [Anaerolineae bacterium]